jgi:enterobactin synthetase component D
VLRSTSRLDLAHGACVVIELGDAEAALARLPAAEQARAAELSAIRRSELIAGRTALHLALAPAAPASVDHPILSDDRGAPRLPPGWVGSVSHKAGFAAALVAPAGDGHIGVDLERAEPPRHDISRRVLTPREQTQLPTEPVARGRAITLRFAIKEAIYKAIDPYLRRYVGFLEAELDFTDDAVDAVRVTSELPLRIEASWRELAGHWLATARAWQR